LPRNVQISSHNPMFSSFGRENQNLGVYLIFWGLGMAIFKKSVKICQKVRLLLLSLTLNKAVRTLKLSKTLKMVFLYGLGYEFSKKSEIWGFWQVLHLGFFTSGANCAQFAQKVKFWKKFDFSRKKSDMNENDPSF